jgi:hypothetical protein
MAMNGAHAAGSHRHRLCSDTGDALHVIHVVCVHDPDDVVEHGRPPSSVVKPSQVLRLFQHSDIGLFKSHNCGWILLYGESQCACCTGGPWDSRNSLEPFLLKSNVSGSCTDN